jgi:hypothetical protein
MASHDPGQSRTEHLLILALAVVAITGSFVMQSSERGGLEFPLPCAGKCVALPETCLSRTVFGVSCPGCGLTRSFVALSAGNGAEAVRLNLMGPILYVLCWLQIPYRVAEYFTLGRSIPLWNRVRGVLSYTMWVVLVGLVATWIARLCLAWV